jgi:hypothetical protein
MSDDQVTVATFLGPAEAEVIRARLDEEGIPAIILGDASSGAITGVADYETGIRVAVAAENAERARALLETVRQEARADATASGLPLTAAGHPGWVCPECQTVVDVDLEVCPSCGSVMDLPMDERSAAARAIAASEEVDPPEQKEGLKTWVGDKLAGRAFKTAVIGLLLFPPVLHVYALSLLWRLRLKKCAVSDKSWGRAFWAWLVSCTILALPVWFVAAILLGSGSSLLGILGLAVVGAFFFVTGFVFPAGRPATSARNEP